MALETASYVANLVTSNPDGGDQRSTADDHLRLIKACLVRTFPKVDAAVSLSAVQYSYLNDLSASVQIQLNQLRDGSATANNAINARFANSASTAAFIGATPASDVARLSQSATFGTDLNVNKGSASLYLIDPTANADEKRWRLANISATWRLETRTDANAFGAAPISMTRSGTTVTDIALAATTITLTGTVNGTISNAVNATNAANATNATNASNANAAAFATSAGSSALLSGLPPRDTADANSIAQRNSEGDLFAFFVNQSSPIDDNANAINSIMVTRGDNYVRKAGLANFGSQIESRNISGKSGTTKTLSSSAPIGGGNGDIWYQY